MPDGSVYDGEWDNDMKQGRGTMIFCNGSKYEGTFFEDKVINLYRICSDTITKQPHGSGIFSYANGCKFEGKWVLGFREGKCTYSIPEKGVFSGVVKDSMIIVGKDITFQLPSEMPWSLTSQGPE